MAPESVLTRQGAIFTAAPPPAEDMVPVPPPVGRLRARLAAYASSFPVPALRRSFSR